MRVELQYLRISTKEVDNVVHIGRAEFAAWMWQLPARYPSFGASCEDLCGFCVLQPCETSSHQQCICPILVSKPGTGVILPAHVEVRKIALKPRHGVPHHVFPVTEPSGNNDLSKVIDGTSITDRIIKCKLTDGVSVVDELRGVTAVVTSHQNNTIGRLPGGVSHSGLNCSGGVWLPASSVGFELQTGRLSVIIGSATENVPCLSVPHSGTAGDGW